MGMFKSKAEAEAYADRIISESRKLDEADRAARKAETHNDGNGNTTTVHGNHTGITGGTVNGGLHFHI